MFGRKTQHLETVIKKLNWELERTKNDVRLLEEEVEEIKVSRRKWRDRASNLRRERRHLTQELQLKEVRPEGETLEAN